MKSAILTVLAVVLAGSAVAQGPVSPPPAKTKAPRIGVEPASFNFGKSLPGKTLTKEFTIRNFGNEDLVLQEPTTSCGCTTAPLEQKVVKPGRSVPLRVSLETRNYSGPIERTVSIQSNDPSKTHVVIKVETTVVPATSQAP